MYITLTSSLCINVDNSQYPLMFLVSLNKAFRANFAEFLSMHTLFTSFLIPTICMNWNFDNRARQNNAEDEST